METLYYLAFNRAAHSPFWLWLYRRIAAARQIGKHAQRRNWHEAWRYLRIL